MSIEQITKETLWEKVRDTIRRELSEQSFDTWIAPARLISYENESVMLAVPNDFFAGWLRERYQELIASSFAVHGGRKPSIEYVVQPSDEQAKIDPAAAFLRAQPADSTDVPSQQEGGHLNRYTFDTFVVGSSSRFAHAAAYAVSEAPARKYNPLFIYGQVGLGKTHLLQAILHEVKTRRPTLNPLYITSEKFMNHLINAIQNRTTMEFRRKFRNVDVLLIDDIHFLAGKDATQEEFFHTFNDLYDRQKQIVITSDRPPKDIPGLEDRLVSRFEWGLVTDIQPPDFETRVAILRKKMERETVTVPDEVAFFIASKIKSNIRELEGALIRVVAYSSLIGHSLNLELAKSLLKDTLTEEEGKLTIDFIQQKTADYYKIKLSDMRTKKRNKSISYPRQIAMYIVRNLTEHSLPEIGEYFGGRDHTTVLHGIAKIEKEIKSNIKTKKEVDDILRVIKGG